jgi:hypothetical protein
MAAKLTLRSMAALAVVAMAMLFAASAASAQGYPGAATLTLSSPTVPQGGTLRATMTGCQPGEPVHFVLNSDPLDMGTVPADGTGTGTVTVTIPSTFPPGAHTVTSTCGALTLSADVTVLAQATTQTTVASGPLPTTGSDTEGLVRGGIALVALGGLLVVAATTFARRRDTVSS